MPLASRLVRRTASIAAVAAAVTAVTVVMPASSGAARARAASACPASGLVAWLDTSGNGAAGTIYYQLHFTNLSSHACTLRGYPGVSAANPSGQSIGPGAPHSTPGVRTVTLGNGRTATANLGIVEAGNFPVLTCRPTTAAGLRVYAPGATTARFVPFPFAACRRTANLRIGAVR